MDISVLGVDLGKNVCSVVGLDASGAVVMRRKVRRETLGVSSQTLMGHYRVIRRMRYGTDSTRERHNDRGGPSSDTA